MRVGRGVGTLVAAAVGGVGLLGGSTASAAPADAEITYSVHQEGRVRSDIETFARIARSTLQDPRGWSLGGRIDFRRLPSGADMRLVLASPASVDAAAPACDAAWSCRTGRRVLINDYRWRHASPAWSLSLRAYRHYVINHEVGHFLGLEHRHCREPGAPAPVMQQQSIDSEGCRSNVWPRLAELRAAARHQDVPAPTRSPAPAMRHRGHPGHRTEGHGGTGSERAASPAHTHRATDSSAARAASRAEVNTGPSSPNGAIRDIRDWAPVLSLMVLITAAALGGLAGGAVRVPPSHGGVHGAGTAGGRRGRHTARGLGKNRYDRGGVYAPERKTRR